MMSYTKTHIRTVIIIFISAAFILSLATACRRSDSVSADGTKDQSQDTTTEGITDGPPDGLSEVQRRVPRYHDFPEDFLTPFAEFSDGYYDFPIITPAYFCDGDVCWLAGEMGKSTGSWDIFIYYTADRGSTWQKINNRPGSVEGIRYYPTAMYFINDMAGIVVGDNRDFRRLGCSITYDGGKTWTYAFEQDFSSDNWKDHIGIDSNDLFPLDKFDDIDFFFNSFISISIEPIDGSSAYIVCSYEINGEQKDNRMIFDKNGLH